MMGVIYMGIILMTSLNVRGTVCVTTSQVMVVCEAERAQGRKRETTWVALMIQLEKFVGGVGWVVGWLTPTTYIQLDGAGSII